MENQFEFEQEKDIRTIFEEVKKANDQIIKSGKDIFPFCFVIKENKGFEYFSLAKKLGNLWVATNPKEIRDNLFRELVKRKIIGYIIVDEFKGIATRTLYTPKTIIKNIVYRNSLAESTTEGRNKLNNELYDLW